MSGGYYDYLCHKCANRELYEEDLATIEAMAKDLEEGGFWSAADRSRDVVAKIRGAYAIADRLMGVWQAQEWYKSNDWSLEQVKEANNKYIEAELRREILEEEEE